MRELCKSGGGSVGGGGGNNINGGTTIVATVVAVLEKQHQQNSQRSFPLKYHRNINNSITLTNQNYNHNSSCSNSADEHFQTAVKDFDSVAEDVEKIVQQTNSLKREKIKHQQQQENIKTERTCSEDFYRQKSGGGDCFIDTDVLETDYLTYQRPDAVHSSTVIVNNDSFSDDDDDDDDVYEDDVNNSSDSDSSSNSDDSSEKEHIIAGEGLATIAEEEHNTTPTSSVSYKGLVEQEDGEDLVDSSSLEDEEETLKDNTVAWTIDGDVCNSFNNSTTDISSTTSSEQQQTLKDSSTRCNNDFQWMQCKEMINMDETLPITKPPINRSKTPKRDKSSPSPGPSGSLDRLRHQQHHHQQQQQQQSRRQQRDQKARSSSHILKSPPPRLDDFIPCQNWCCNPSPHETTTFYDNYHYRRSEPPNHIDSSSSQRYGSYPDLYGNDYNRYRHEQMISGGGGGCCSYHMPPPCCFYGGDRLGYHWSVPYLKPSTDQDEKLRKLQYEKENLQLQVQVLQEQIEAQSDKIIDLEKTLNDKKQILQDTEEKLQQEVLSRSSLETQKLELMSIMSELKLQQATLERENIELRSQFNNNNNNNTNNNELKKPPRNISAQNQLLSSTPIHHHQHTTSNQGIRMTPSPSPVSLISNSPRRVESTTITTTPTTSQHENQPPKTPPATYKRQIDIRYGSLPRQQFINNGNNSTDSDANPSSSSTSKKGVVFGRGLSSLIGVRAKGYSVPNLAETEKIVIEDGSGNIDNSGDNQTIQFGKNTKGIKKIFGRMKRSGSGNLDDLPGINEFQRGGVRATAAARLGWSEPQLTIRPDKPFTEWDTENICDWLQDLGLDQYISDAKRYIKDGQQLQEASINDIEKELNIKNPLHKKKLQLALIDMIENGTNDPYLKKAGKLDTSWILRWLDDTGLPQYKENFLINRIDGRVLHRLTIDDLQLLHITSLLHVISIKRGIQVLRENDYEANCLQRRSLPDDPKQPTPKQITLWTTHRCMEWLRQCDLAEYAPNLRGAGVHGGLFVYETKFTGELLATLLSIPPGKTLLRRHLNTRFNELLGKEIIQEKRDAENTLGYIPLTPSAKLKIAKKSQFSLKRKKSKSEADYGDLVCPLNPDNKQSGELNGSALNNMGMMMMKMENRKDEDASPHHVEYTVRSSPASIANSPLPQRHV